MPQLRCVSRYSTDAVSYAPGVIVDANEDEAARLLRDSPGSFEVVSGDVRVGAPNEYVGYEPPARPPEPPVRGQQPLREGSIVATVRQANRVTGDVIDVTPRPEPAAAQDADEGEAVLSMEEAADVLGDVTEDDGETVVHVDFEDLTVADLRVLAADRGIDLTGKRTRAEIIAAIEGDDDAEGD